MSFGIRRFPILAVWAALAFCPLLMGGTGPAHAANSIKIVVNGDPITSYDISSRMQFLRLRHEKGDLRKKAREELIDETLKTQAISRAGASVSTAQVDDAFARFSQNNKLSPAKMKTILERAGVGITHFKHYIAVQMSWPRVVAGQERADNAGDSMLSKMLENGKNKPSTTEYVLQQVIFVVPNDKRSAILGQRKNEASAMRARFNGCDNTRNVAARLTDVAVRDLGRVMQPKLPPMWKDAIENTKPGSATQPKVTDRGVEFIGVCSAHTVSDDLAAETVFQSEESSQENTDASKDMLKKLRENASIVYK
ncbi:SurA N-terminal domain-containing protein [Pararhizobium mangrovi]|uniref:Peptidylprolyl isomerase n=1 Tax=Pararhizobium mangrovi TaxID=2590452 RepID=A0A506UEY4_9HYPH|nr:peptidylprolyl isomerase [Pararhizobium mangrovi]TPW32046.1 peptidylprolyl isomerase [Pararhizobium mangrovi]